MFGKKSPEEKAAKQAAKQADKAAKKADKLQAKLQKKAEKKLAKTQKKADKKALKDTKKGKNSKASTSLLKQLKGHSNKAAKVGTTLAPSLLPIVYTAVGLAATYLKGRD